VKARRSAPTWGYLYRPLAFNDSAIAPFALNLEIASSALAMSTPVKITERNSSANTFGSFKPRPVSPRITLIVSILFGRDYDRTTPANLALGACVQERLWSGVVERIWRPGKAGDSIDRFIWPGMRSLKKTKPRIESSIYIQKPLGSRRQELRSTWAGDRI